MTVETSEFVSVNVDESAVSFPTAIRSSAALSSVTTQSQCNISRLRANIRLYGCTTTSKGPHETYWSCMMVKLTAWLILVWKHTESLYYLLAEAVTEWLDTTSAYFYSRAQDLVPLRWKIPFQNRCHRLLSDITQTLQDYRCSPLPYRSFRGSLPV